MHTAFTLIQNHKGTSLVSVIFAEIKKRQLISPRMPQGLDNDLSQASLTKKVHIHYTHIYTLTETTETCTHNTLHTCTQYHTCTHIYHTHVHIPCSYYIYIHTHISHTHTYAQRPHYTSYICTHIHTHTCMQQTYHTCIHTTHMYTHTTLIPHMHTPYSYRHIDYIFTYMCTYIHHTYTCIHRHMCTHIYMYHTPH